MKSTLAILGGFAMAAIWGAGFVLAGESRPVPANGEPAKETEWVLPSLEQLSQEFRDGMADRKPVRHYESLAEERRRKVIKEVSEKWQRELGQVDFTKKPLFNCMTYLHPKPRSCVLPFKGVALSTKVKADHGFWMGMFFKGNLLGCLQNASPTGYYLHDEVKSREHGESSLLFEVAHGQDKITLVETGHIVFMTIEPKQYDPATGVTKEFMETFIASVLNVDKEKCQSVLSGFAFPARIAEGYTFISPDGDNFLKSRDWREHLVGFVGKTGVSIILFKIKPRNPRDPRIIIFEGDDGSWLRKGLLKEDGKPLSAGFAVSFSASPQGHRG